LPNQVHALAFSPDSKWLGSAGSDGGIYIWEAATGKEVLRLTGHEGEVATVAFSPDGRTIFSQGQDGQGYLWNLRPKPVAGQPAARKDLWTDLAGTDAAKAYRAGWAFADDPPSVDYLRTKLPAAVQPDKARLAKLIADLDSDKFDDREAATRALADLAELAAPAMEEACKSTGSAEQRRRLEGLLATLKDRMSPAQIMQARVVQALELAGTTDARKALQEWASGAAGARLTEDAKAALARLDTRR
jgi:WD domain, G-beta repeat